MHQMVGVPLQVCWASTPLPFIPECYCPEVSAPATRLFEAASMANWGRPSPPLHCAMRFVYCRAPPTQLVSIALALGSISSANTMFFAAPQPTLILVPFCPASLFALRALSPHAFNLESNLHPKPVTLPQSQMFFRGCKGSMPGMLCGPNHKEEGLNPTPSSTIPFRCCGC